MKLALVAVLIGGLASSARANPYLDEGRGLVGALQLKEAIAPLELARRAPTLTTIERVETLELLARCRLAEGERDQAQATYAELLTLQPEHELDASQSPKLLATFSEVKARLYPGDWVRLSQEPTGKGWLELRVLDPWRLVRQVTVELRGAAPRRVLCSLAHGRCRVALQEQDLSWRAVAGGERGELASREGVLGAPVSTLTQAQTPAWRRHRIAALVLGGVALASAGLATGLRVSSDAAAREAQNTRWVDDARRFQVDATGKAIASDAMFVVAGGATVGAGLFLLW